MRRNRFDAENTLHVHVHSNPQVYNRETRRSAGYRKPTGILPDGVEAPQEFMYPRYARRHAFAFSPLVLSIRRVRKQRSRLLRSLRSMTGGAA